MVNIKTIFYSLLALLIVLLSFSTWYYKNKYDKTALELNNVVVVSEQIFKDKQAQVDVIEKRANEYLIEAKKDYEKIQKRVSSVVNIDRVRGSSETSPNTSDPVRGVQISTELVEPDGCEIRYKKLWDVWQDLCLIYGCTR